MESPHESAFSDPPASNKPGLLRRWFGFDTPVTRGFYAASGFGLLLLKYAGEAASLWVSNGKFFTPLDFINPLLTERMKLLEGAPEWLIWGWVLWTFPFLWIALSMSVRRAVNAGVTPLPGLLIFIPGVNLITMLLLAILPENLTQLPPDVRQTPANVAWVRAALSGVLGGLALGIAMLSLNVYALGNYGAALFLGTPVMMGMLSSFLWSMQAPRGYGASALLGIATVMMSGAWMLLFGLEGAICILMAAPLATPLGALGGVLGCFIARCGAASRRSSLGMLLILPGWSGVEAWQTTRGEFQVTTSVAIAASPEKVWETVIGFPPIDPPTEWYFKYGIAYPIRGEIFGTGVGAIRHCVFSTGTFVEPITVWDAPHRLAFNVAQQPVPMFELSPWKHVHPPHLDGALRSTHGEFLLEPLPDGGTLLTGHSWYEFDMHPRSYWTFWGHVMIHRIHHRVLDHVKAHAEAGTVESSVFR